MQSRVGFNTAVATNREERQAERGMRLVKLKQNVTKWVILQNQNGLDRDGQDDRRA